MNARSTCATSTNTEAMATAVSARIRMHRMHELGDCFLITFTAGTKKSHMLIDCGTFRNGADSKARIQEVVKSIKTELKGKPLNVVVGTHQHNDHLNGFEHAFAEFKSLGVDQVWLSWLDDPTDGLATDIGEQYNNLRSNLLNAAAHMKAKGLSGRAAEWLRNTEGLLGFFAGAKKTDGSPAALPEEARKKLQVLGKKDPDYLNPGESLDMPGLPKGAVRVHVLGPPRKQSELERKDPRQGESYDKELARAAAFGSRFVDALKSHTFEAGRKKDEKEPSELREEVEYPFNQRTKVKENADDLSPAMRAMIANYRDPQHSWRNIDNDWLEQAEGLALWLDDFTNNSSLVLAIELVASKKVLLFAADAQTGNWSSWKDVQWEDANVSTQDLLDRTVLYKVGHHGSHNSTHKHVFDTMKNPELVALIPVDKSDSNIAKGRHWKMPADKLFDVIKEKTHNRVLQMDGVDPADCDPKSAPVKAAWKKVGITPVLKDDYVELTIK